MVEVMMFGILLAVLFAGGLVTDHIFPRIRPIRRYIDSLPLCSEDSTRHSDMEELMAEIELKEAC